MATTNFIAKLIQGANSLNLHSAPYELGADFTPPETFQSPLFASGTSANRTGGAAKVGSTATNRAFSFSINIEGTSEAHVRRALTRVQAMLDNAGDPANPVYLSVRPNSDIASEPLWGNYGAALNYEIAHGTASFAGMYSVSDLRGRALPGCMVDLIIKPFALGRRQLIATATGGIIEDTIGTVDGRSRGVVVPEGGNVQNKFTNPMNGSATYSTNWTAGADIVATQNTDPAFDLFAQFHSVKLDHNGGAGSIWTQSLNPGNTNNHTITAYVKMPDGSAVTSTQCRLVMKGSAQTTTFIAVGNGWYRARAMTTATNAATAYGVEVRAGYSIYVTGFQLEQRAYATDLCHGDLLGCSWSSTAHASTSIRVDAVLSLPTGIETIMASQGSIRVVWFPPDDLANTPGGRFFDLAGSSDMYGRFLTASNIVNFTIGATDITTAAQSFTARVPVILHFTWGQAGAAIYVAGASAATTATFVLPTVGASLFIGRATTAADYIGGTLSLATFPTPMTAGEVASDYANILPVATDGQRVDAIPYLWTKDGDNVVDNTTDTVLSTGFPHNNYAVVAGIPGSAPAVTRFRLTGSYTSDVYSVYMSNFAHSIYINPASILAFVQGGTVGAVTDSDKAYTQTSLNTSAVLATGAIAAPNTHLLKAIGGREFYFFARLYDAGTTLQLLAQFQFAGGDWRVYTGYKSVTATTTPKWLFSDPLTFPTADRLFLDGPVVPAILNCFLTGNRTTPGANNVRIDELVLMPRPLAKLDSAAAPGIIWQGREAVNLTPTPTNYGAVTMQGDVIELVPGVVNTLLTIIGEVINTAVIEDHLTYTSVWVTPRYALA